MSCKILTDKRTGDEFLVPYCYGVANNMWQKDITDRELIKEYCCCDRTIKEKYETKTRDEVFNVIAKLKENIVQIEDKLKTMKEDLSFIETEVFMLNVVETT